MAVTQVTMRVASATMAQTARTDGYGGVESSSNFPSLVGDVCVATGAWMYEVTLLSAGLQQLGWATVDCVYTYENGVGDSPGKQAAGKRRRGRWKRVARCDAGPTCFGPKREGKQRVKWVMFVCESVFCRVRGP